MLAETIAEVWSRHDAYTSAWIQAGTSTLWQFVHHPESYQAYKCR
jgi:hypothetical protein